MMSRPFFGFAKYSRSGRRRAALGLIFPRENDAPSVELTPSITPSAGAVELRWSWNLDPVPVDKRSGEVDSQLEVVLRCLSALHRWPKYSTWALPWGGFRG
jgi:hypothetical protein